jgi:hypothetical protein
MGNLFIVFAVRVMACVGKNVFKECWQFIFQKVSVNVVCQALNATVMQPDKCYQQLRSSSPVDVQRL